MQFQALYIMYNPIFRGAERCCVTLINSIHNSFVVVLVPLEVISLHIFTLHLYIICDELAVYIRARLFSSRFSNATANSKLYQCCSGLSIDLLKMLSEKISFDFELFEVPDKKWGAYDKVRHSSTFLCYN